MQKSKLMLLAILLVLCVFVIIGCKDSATEVSSDKGKTIEQIKTQASKMDVKQLMAKAVQYKDLISEKTAQVGDLQEKIAAKVKTLSPAQLMGGDMKDLRDQASELGKTLKNLSTKFKVYYDLLVAKKADVSKLK